MEEFVRRKYGFRAKHPCAIVGKAVVRHNNRRNPMC